MEFYLELHEVTEYRVVFNSGKNIVPEVTLNFKRDKWEAAGAPLKIYVWAVGR